MLTLELIVVLINTSTDTNETLTFSSSHGNRDIRGTKVLSADFFPPVEIY